MASSNISISSVRLSSRRSGEPFSSLVVVDGYCHCFFCDLMTEFEKKGVVTPGLNSHTAAAGCVLFRTGDPTYCHAAYVTKVSGGVVYYDQVMTNCIVHFNILSIVD
jgi:hypothetical protein